MKIGYSKNVESRIRQLTTAIPGEVELLSVIDASHGVEQQLHRQLKGFRVQGGGREWYTQAVLKDAVLLSMMTEGTQE